MDMCEEYDISVHNNERMYRMLREATEDRRAERKGSAVGATARKRKEKDGYFATPSSKIPIKSNTSEENQTNNGGAVAGHKGHGRKSATSETVEIEGKVAIETDVCSDCGELLEDRGYEDRTVIESAPVRVQ